MTVFVIADTLCRTKAQGVTETRMFIRSVCGAADSDEARDVFVSEFGLSREFYDGWLLLDVPEKLDVNQPEVDLWQQYVPSVYIMADSLLIQRDEGPAVKVFMRSLYAVDSRAAAYEKFRGEFEQSKDFRDGWQLLRAPSALDVRREEIEVWSEYVHSAEIMPFRPKMM